MNAALDKVNAGIWKLALLLGVLLAYVVANDVHVGFWVETPHASITTTVDSTPGKNIFNPDAELDTSQIDYEPTTVLLPTDTDVVTPCIMFEGVYVPEESPDGGYPTHWEDNSPAYSDGWLLQVNDATHTVKWIELKD